MFTQCPIVNAHTEAQYELERHSRSMESFSRSPPAPLNIYGPIRFEIHCLLHHLRTGHVVLRKAVEDLCVQQQCSKTEHFLTERPVENLGVGDGMTIAFWNKNVGEQ